MRQTRKRTELRKPFKTRMKSAIKKVLVLSKTDKEAAKKELSAAYKAIDIIRDRFPSIWDLIQERQIWFLPTTKAK